MGTAECEPLSGRVEIDETFIGGHRTGVGGRGSAGKTLAAGVIEGRSRGWGRARLAVIPEASAASLGAFVRANVEAGSIVAADGWQSYPRALTGYTHGPFNVSASGRPAHESLPAVHRLFAQVKRLLDGTYQGGGSIEPLSEYLDEFVFRFNRRHSRNRGLVFMRLLQRVVNAAPVTYRNLDRVPAPQAGVMFTGPEGVLRAGRCPGH